MYNVLIEQLPQEKMDKVREKQIQWINIRDSIAEKNGKKFEGGTMQPLVYTDSLGETTKERCYELVNKYMK
ncbi:lysozyme inhibitor LprI family protein [Clostridium sp. MB05]|uniref:lysozyme inhibitor LprI family protein n=1 Tax=Clostridium sp. MB05 TaxID=3376682 RepID=UPI00398204D0